jgi:hypothetical protein
MKDKKNSNTEKEMMYILHLLNEDDSFEENVRIVKEEIAKKSRVFVTDDIRDKIVAITGNNDIKLGQLVKLNVEQLDILSQELPGLRIHNIGLTKNGVPIVNSPEYIFSTVRSTDDLRKLLDKQFSNLARKISLIGAGVGAGITAAGWAAARAYLQRQLKKCGDDSACIEKVKAKISELNRMALLGGLGLTSLGSYAAARSYTPSF